MKKLTAGVLTLVLSSSLAVANAQQTKKDSVKTQDIEGVVVTALGIKRQSKASSYGAAIVDGNKIREVANTTPFESLSGKVAGVDFSSPAQPGATPKIISRGFKSLTSNQPLYVIDGTPMLNVSSSKTGFDSTYDTGSSVNDLDPNTIESINFLKGAAATSLYGKDGANGVVLITTKKGKGRLKVDLTSSIDFSEVSRLPHIQQEFGQGWSGHSWSFVNGEGDLAASNENGSWGPKFDGKIRPWGRIYNNMQQIKPYVGLEDAAREFFDIGTTYINSLGISGGGENADGAFTLSDLNSDGVFPSDQDKFMRRTLGFNGGLKFNKFKLRVSTNYSHRKVNAVPSGQGDDASFGKSLFQELLQMPTDVSFVDMEDMGNIFNTPSYFFTPYAANPYTTLANNNVRAKADRFYGNTNFSYDFTDKLSASLQLGADIQNEQVKRWGAIVDYIPGSPQDLAGANGVVGAVSETKRTDRLYDAYLTVNYNTDLAENWKLSTALGGGYNEKNGNVLGALVTDLDLPNFYELSNSASTPTLIQNDYKQRYYYVFGSAELGFKDRYFLTVTGRNDWSSTLPVQNNSYFYPSVGVSAIVLNDQNFLKLRGSWARAGKDTAPYSVYSFAGQSANTGFFGQLAYPFGGVNSYEIGNRITNENLVNELTTEVEFGTEGRFFKNRLEFDISVYDRLTEDMLLDKLLPKSTGYTTILGNFASIRNRGIEVLLNGYPIKANNFQWNMTYTFTKNKSKVEDIAGEEKDIILTSNYGIDFRFVEGESYGSFYAQVPKTTASGQYIINPDNGFYEVTETPQKIGSAERDFIMGLTNKFTYKNFSLSFGLDWKQGGDMYSYTKRLSHFVGNGIETLYNDRNPFIIPNSVIDNGNGTYSENTIPVSFEAVTNYYNTQNNPGIERTHVIDKTFIRLRDVSLTYSLPKSLLRGTGLNGASVTLYGKNLFLWTPKENPYVDPESTTYGNDILSEMGEFSANPTQRYYGAMFKFNF
ncbi:TonB-linked SusC/RagA family outer membrane protein [Chryseobacterium defluvii]|uniref:TonB-linked SusC/RagA family outer membrane protein n=1 Tax=Chryseobacterium defluvii TaxID=160396 RepID=A0A840KIA4_9FLAO|nr:SusC/RagA family TonB-linked outer membrane protein [Chryseobacterium defluvii]MBB4807414.1 TonB-linked SusC/RagA family outer membrane protein [Chryseobacterium defluvii]